jgi:hypothetical protein
MKHKIVSVAALVLLSASLTACKGFLAPSPLYGTWNDNKGNKIVFISDLSFSATVNGEQLTGTYTVNENALSLAVDNGNTIVSEWDIRGSMLYLDWTDKNGTVVNLTLYKTAN